MAEPRFRPGRTLFLLGGVTVLLFGGGGVLLMEVVQQRSLLDALQGQSLLSQVVSGVLVGLGIGAGAWAIIRTPWQGPVRERYARLIGPYIVSPWARWGVSLCAGVGEELFFRGALQHWLGIPLTAVIFVAIHGYLDPRDRRLFTYGAALTAGMLVLGWMAREQGLLGPIIAHTLIDVVLLERLHTTWRRLVAEA